MVKKFDYKFLGVVVVVAIVVALFVSLMVPSLTGNAVWWKQRNSARVVNMAVTYQGVLDMMTIGSGGGCGYYMTPHGDKWDSSDGDYQEEVVPFIEADSNRDSITTGAEFCSSLGKTCISGFQMQRVLENYEGSYRHLVKNPIGCFGGLSYEDLEEDERYNEYYCCSPLN